MFGDFACLLCWFVDCFLVIVVIVAVLVDKLLLLLFVVVVVVVKIEERYRLFESY